MTDELDDTKTSPTRAAALERLEVIQGAHPTGDVVGDTVMSIRSVAELVEPARQKTSPRSVTDAISAFLPASPEPVRAASYSFRVGNRAETVMLDRPARVGREPAVTRISTGVSPRLVRVYSPSSEVSGTHLEVRQVGASVIVTDLRSTNGSVVTQPGSLPRKLRQGESVVVTPGTLVDIGDGNILHILPMQRLG
jgi:FHA domain